MSVCVCVCVCANGDISVSRVVPFAVGATHSHDDDEDDNDNTPIYVVRNLIKFAASVAYREASGAGQMLDMRPQTFAIWQILPTYFVRFAL